MNQTATRVMMLAAAIGLAGCQPAAGRDAPPSVFHAVADEDAHPTPEVSTAELTDLLAEGGAVVIDARPREEYDLGHIPGAIFLPGKPGMPASKHTADASQAHRYGEPDDVIIIYCNGINCGKTSRLADDLLSLGYTDVRRYQLGIPVWRALGGVCRVAPDAAVRALADDATAVLIDARSPEAFERSSAPGARNVPPDQVVAAENDGRLPMTDHNTRLFIVAETEQSARSMAEALSGVGFHNVGFIAGTVSDLRAAAAAR